MRGYLQDAGGRWGVDEVGVGFHCYESSTKLWIKWGVGVVANKGAEGSVRSNAARAAESIAEKASPTNSLTRSREPFVGGAAAQLWRFLHGSLNGTRWIRVVEIVEEPLRGGDNGW